MVNIFSSIAGVSGIGVVLFIMYWFMRHKGAFFHGGRLLDRIGKEKEGLEKDEFRLETDLEHINKDLGKKQRFEKRLEKKELREDKKQIHLCNIIIFILEAQRKLVQAFKRHGFNVEESLKERREFNEQRTEFYDRMRELRQSLLREAQLLLREIAVETGEIEEAEKEEKITGKEEKLEKKEAAEEEIEVGAGEKKELNEEIITGKIEDLSRLEHSKLNQLIVINKRWLEFIKMLLSNAEKSFFIRIIGFQRKNLFYSAEQNAHYLMYYLLQKRKDVLAKRGITWSKKKLIGSVGALGSLWKRKARKPAA
jgi:hypothetical protein